MAKRGLKKLEGETLGQALKEAKASPVARAQSDVRIMVGDVFAQLALLEDASVDCVVTSPPYWGLRDYGVDGQIGLEPTLQDHLDVMVKVARELRRVLKPEGTLWLNYGDCYATTPNGRSAADTKAAGNDDRTFRDKPISTIGGKFKPKDLMMIPNRLAIALHDDGWWVRAENVWGKNNPMPDSSGKYRPSSAHEKVFMLAKSARCHYDELAVAQPCSEATHARVAQNVAAQAGSMRANGGGKTNGPMKAVVRGRSTHGRQTLGDALPAAERRALGVTPKTADAPQGTRANPSMSASIVGAVETRYLRSYEPAPLHVWEIATAAFSEAHFATFPPELAERCILAGCPQGGLVLDPFGGAGTVGLVAAALKRRAILIELNPDYAAIASRRLKAGLVRVEGGESRRGLDALPLFGGDA